MVTPAEKREQSLSLIGFRIIIQRESSSLDAGLYPDLSVIYQRVLCYPKRRIDISACTQRHTHRKTRKEEEKKPCQHIVKPMSCGGTVAHCSSAAPHCSDFHRRGFHGKYQVEQYRVIALRKSRNHTKICFPPSMVNTRWTKSRGFYIRAGAA